MNYEGKIFKPLFNSDNGEVDEEMLFHYKQKGNVLTCDYSGNNIITGHLIGLVAENGVINMRYHQVNKQGEICTGICTSTPQILENGKIELHEKWRWTSGDHSSGESVLLEL